MGLPENLRALRILLHGGEEIPRDLAAFDPPEFRRFVARNQLAGTVYASIQEHGCPEWLPEDTAGHFKLHYLQQWKRNEENLRQCATVRDAMDAAAVRHCFLKGVFLASRYYGDIDARYTRDIDLMIFREDLQRAEGALAPLGFARRSKVLISDAATIPFTHHFEYTSPHGELELHWSLAEHVSFRLDPRAVLHHRTSCTIGKQSFGVPCDEHALLTQLLGAFRDIELGTSTLKPFLDMHRMLMVMDEATDWSAFFERRRQERVLRIAVNMLALTQQLWDSHADAPQVSAALARHSEFLQPGDPQQAIEIVSGTQPIAARKWAWRLYEAHPLRSLCWWAVSLPFRVAVSGARSGS